jgi:hypothetical protein
VRRLSNLIALFRTSLIEGPKSWTRAEILKNQTVKITQMCGMTGVGEEPGDGPHPSVSEQPPASKVHSLCSWRERR